METEFKQIVRVENPDNKDVIECWYRQVPSEIKFLNKGLEMIIDTNTVMVLFPELFKILNLLKYDPKFYSRLA
ncbi:MAG: hypothetical protein EOL97_13735 [Spirochaetia bacterium]|nr:hypothetical protein [Spirochaetia bacterium]